MDDLISRQRLLKELKHHKELFCRNRIQFLGLSKNDKARVDEIDNCYAMVINAPSAQPEQKKGEWIYGEDEYGIDGYHCNKCGFFVPWDYAHKFINYIEDYNFCPNCGADMREENT